MQNAKDTFYVTLRDRLAAVNPARTMVLRGVTRPGVLVEENELTSASVPVDAFCLQWTGMSVDAQGALPLVTMVCEIRYATDGDAGNGGMDRGRLMAGMDAELVAAVSASPQNTRKMNYAARRAGRACRLLRWRRMCSGAMWLLELRWRMESGWSGWRRLRYSATRKRVSCEYDCDCGWFGGGGRSRDAAGASLLCAGESGGRSADGVRCGADGGVCVGCTAGAVGGSGMVLGFCAEECDEDWSADDRGAGGGAEPGGDAGGGDGAARV